MEEKTRRLGADFTNAVLSSCRDLLEETGCTETARSFRAIDMYIDADDWPRLVEWLNKWSCKPKITEHDVRTGLEADVLCAGGVRFRKSHVFDKGPSWGG